jgi:phage FluMu gp28-like protein
LSRDPDAELIFTTTPGGMNGQFYEIYQTAKNDPNWYVQETTIYDAIADGLKIDLESLRTLCQDPEVFA